MELVLAAFLTLLSMIVVVVSRIVIRIKYPEARGEDAGLHWAFIDEIKQNSHSIPRHWSRAIFSCRDSGYPYLYHWLLSFLPERALHYWDRFGVAVLDFIHSIWFLITVFSLSLLTDQAHLDWLVLSSGLLLFVTSPLTTRVAARSLGLSARPFGHLLFTQTFCLSLWWIITQNLVVLFLFWISAGLVALSSKFAMQALSFIFPLAGLLTGYWIWVLTPIFALSSALILSRGQYLWVLQTHIFHSLTLAKLFKQNNHQGLRKAVTPTTRGSFLRKAAKTILERNRITSGLIYCPILIIIIGIVIFEIDLEIFRSSWILWALVLAGVLVWILTSTRFLDFLGEGDRYIEYFIIPLICLILFSPLNAKAVIIITAIAIHFAFLIFNIALFVHLNSPTRDSDYIQDQKEVISYLRRIEAEGRQLRIFLIPLSTAKTFAAFSRHKILMDCMASWKSEYRFAFPFETWPRPTPNLDSVISRFRIDTLIIDNAPIGKTWLPEEISEYEFETESLPRVVLKNQSFVIYSS